MWKIIMIGMCMFFIIGCDELQVNPHIKIESQTCKVQDNSNYSHWCEIPCDSNVFEEAIKCQNGDWVIECDNCSIVEEYTGDLFYCFYSEYYQKDYCLPYTDEVRIEVLEAENITDYWIVNVSG